MMLSLSIGCAGSIQAENQTHSGSTGSARIAAIKTPEIGKIEVSVVIEKTGDFEPGSDSIPAFKLRENGAVQESLLVDNVPPRQETSRTIILADLSNSLTRSQFANFKHAALLFVEKLQPGDLVALITFHHKVYRELNFTADRELLKNRIRHLKQTGRRTMLYDALLEAHKMLADAPARKAILLYTDGKENASHINFDDLIELYTANPVPLFVAGKYSLGRRSKKMGRASRSSFALKRIIRLARISGGDAFRAEDSRDLAKVFYYLSKLRSREFTLTYKTNQKPGATLDLEVDTGVAGQNLVRSYTIPTAPGLSKKKSDTPFGYEKLFAAELLTSLRTHMPEILLSLIVLLLVAVIVMLFFRRQEITVKVENVTPQAFISPNEFISASDKKHEMNKAKLPLEYHHGWLVEKEGPHTGRKYRLNWHQVTLGFADDNSIVIDDNTVSPRHARIEREGKKFILYDLLSENGTYLNSKKLLRPKELNDFDEIGLGRTRLIFRKSASDYGKEA